MYDRDVPMIANGGVRCMYQALRLDHDRIS